MRHNLEVNGMKERSERMSGAKRVFDRVVIGLSMLKPRFRVALGYCPLCNSDAPELDDCPLCDGYHTARGDTFPPPKELKRKWLDEMLDVKRTKRSIKKLVRDSRRRRLAQ
jgi:hypothetical protein